jgi:hypothetical protein
MLEQKVCVVIPNVRAGISYPLVMRQAIAFAREHLTHYAGVQDISREREGIVATVLVRRAVEVGIPSKDYK